MEKVANVAEILKNNWYGVKLREFPIRPIGLIGPIKFAESC